MLSGLCGFWQEVYGNFTLFPLYACVFFPPGCLKIFLYFVWEVLMILCLGGCAGGWIWVLFIYLGILNPLFWVSKFSAINSSNNSFSHSLSLSLFFFLSFQLCVYKTIWCCSTVLDVSFYFLFFTHISLCVLVRWSLLT